jgi:hypothetical protein
MGYWSDALQKPDLWLQDVYVDLGLLVLARAQAALEDGRLITKREAIPLLPRLGVSPDLTAEISARRYGTDLPASTTASNQERAELVRGILTTGIHQLLGKSDERQPGA